MKKNIYLAGKVKNTSISNREGGWRKKMIDDLFNVNINGIGLDSYNDNPSIIRFIDINEKFSYVGPFLYSCDHSCSHGSDYAHGVLTCSPEYDFLIEEKPNLRVLDLSLIEIKLADIIIVNFNETPLKSFGTMGEIGYAHALNKKIFGIGDNIPELWFIQGMCDMCSDINELKNKLIEFDNTYDKLTITNVIKGVWEK